MEGFLLGPIHGGILWGHLFLIVVPFPSFSALALFPTPLPSLPAASPPGTPHGPGLSFGDHLRSRGRGWVTSHDDGHIQAYTSIGAVEVHVAPVYKAKFPVGEIYITCLLL